MNTTDAVFWPIVLRTLGVSGVAVLLSALIGIPLGVWVGLSRRWVKPLLIALVHTGMALPPVVLGLILYILLSCAGPLAFLGWLFTVEAMTLAQFLLALPFVLGVTATAGGMCRVTCCSNCGPWGERRCVRRETRRGGAVLLVGGNIAGQIAC